MPIDRSQFGQVRDKRTMKFFIMTALRALGGHAHPQDLETIAMMTQAANWFDYHDALAELLESEHLLSVELPEKGEYYVNSSLAKEALDLLSAELPAYLKRRIDTAVIEFRAKLRYAEENRYHIEMNEDGTAMLTLSIYDRDQLMFSTTLFMPGREQAELLGRAFYDDPTPYYSNVMQNLGKLLSTYDKKLREEEGFPPPAAGKDS
ncbi:MAG: DUF4364 family protein [Clostridia bacterium]|nr:DUF4364 family protein [Clostridia bacterium]